MNVFSKVAASLLIGGLIVTQAAFAASPREQAQASCEKEAIDNEVDAADRADYVAGCLAELGYNTSASGEESLEESQPENSDSSGDRS